MISDFNILTANKPFNMLGSKNMLRHITPLNNITTLTNYICRLALRNFVRHDVNIKTICL